MTMMIRNMLVLICIALCLYNWQRISVRASSIDGDIQVLLGISTIFDDLASPSYHPDGLYVFQTMKLDISIIFSNNEIAYQTLSFANSSLSVNFGDGNNELILTDEQMLLANNATIATTTLYHSYATSGMFTIVANFDSQKTTLASVTQIVRIFENTLRIELIFPSQSASAPAYSSYRDTIICPTYGAAIYAKILDNRNNDVTKSIYDMGGKISISFSSPSIFIDSNANVIDSLQHSSNLGTNFVIPISFSNVIPPDGEMLTISASFLPIGFQFFGSLITSTKKAILIPALYWCSNIFRKEISADAVASSIFDYSSNNSDNGLNISSIALSDNDNGGCLSSLSAMVVTTDTSESSSSLYYILISSSSWKAEDIIVYNLSSSLLFSTIFESKVSIQMTSVVVASRFIYFIAISTDSESLMVLFCLSLNNDGTMTLNSIYDDITDYQNSSKHPLLSVQSQCDISSNFNHNNNWISLSIIFNSTTAILSTDGGASWSLMSTNVMPNSIVAIEAISRDVYRETWIVMISNTTDTTFDVNGVHTQLIIGKQLKQMKFSKYSQFLFAFDDENVYSSFDGGLSFQYYFNLNSQSEISIKMPVVDDIESIAIFTNQLLIHTRNGLLFYGRMSSNNFALIGTYVNVKPAFDNFGNIILMDIQGASEKRMTLSFISIPFSSVSPSQLYSMVEIPVLLASENYKGIVPIFLPAANLIGFYYYYNQDYATATNNNSSLSLWRKYFTMNGYSQFSLNNVEYLIIPLSSYGATKYLDKKNSNLIGLAKLANNDSTKLTNSVAISLRLLSVTLIANSSSISNKTKMNPLGYFNVIDAIAEIITKDNSNIASVDVNDILGKLLMQKNTGRTMIVDIVINSTYVSGRMFMLGFQSSYSSSYSSSSSLWWIFNNDSNNNDATILSLASAPCPILSSTFQILVNVSDEENSNFAKSTSVVYLNPFSPSMTINFAIALTTSNYFDFNNNIGIDGSFISANWEYFNLTIASASSNSNMNFIDNQYLFSVNLTLKNEYQIAKYSGSSTFIAITIKNLPFTCTNPLQQYLPINIQLSCNPSLVTYSTSIRLQGLSIYSTTISSSSSLSSSNWNSKEMTIIDLPVNYRPPSKKGIDIPLTSNIYNANPSLPLYNSYYKDSYDKARYKQCLGKIDRNDCNCTINEELSNNVEDSDCINQSHSFYAVGVPLHPQIWMTYNNNYQSNTNQAATALLNGYFTLEEMNGRIDFCIDASYCLDILQQKKNFATTEFANNQTAIYLMSSGLYHFRLTPVSNFTSCNIPTEFKIWAINNQIETYQIFSTAALTSQIICVTIFIIYLRYSKRM